MSDTNTVILNGKKYDSQTGALLGDVEVAPESVVTDSAPPALITNQPVPEPPATAPVEAAPPVEVAAPAEQPQPKPPIKVIDGIMRPPAMSHTEVHTKPQSIVVQRQMATPPQAESAVEATPPTPSVAPAPIEPQLAPLKPHKPTDEPALVTFKDEPQQTPLPAPIDVTPPAPLTAPNPLIAHARQQAQTLMRSAVTKPLPTFKRLAKVQTPAGTPIPLPTVQDMLPKRNAINAARLGRSQEVKQSSAIKRFGSTMAGVAQPQQKFAVQVQHLPVQAAPKEEVHPPQRKTIFEDAIANANAHQEPAVAPSKRPSRMGKVVKIAAGGAAALFIVGFILYQNLPTLNLRMAAAHAGFQAVLPAAIAGFSFNKPVQVSGSTLTINFSANTDGRSYSVIEQPSTWDSQTLLENFVAPNNKNYQTVQTAGHTVYLYDGNATWVNANVWYRIANRASLNSAQLTAIASTM